MRLEIADHNIYARSFQSLSFFQHLVCLSDARGVAHENLEFPALLFSHFLLGEQAHVHAVAFPYQFVERAAFESRKSGALTMSDEKLRNPPGSGELEERVCRVVSFQNFDVHTSSVRLDRVSSSMTRISPDFTAVT